MVMHQRHARLRIAIVGGDDRVPIARWPEHYEYRFFLGERAGGRGEAKRLQAALDAGTIDMIVVLNQWMDASLRHIVKAKHGALPIKYWETGLGELVKGISFVVDEYAKPPTFTPPTPPKRAPFNPPRLVEPEPEPAPEPEPPAAPPAAEPLAPVVQLVPPVPAQPDPPSAVGRATWTPEEHAALEIAASEADGSGEKLLATFFELSPSSRSRTGKSIYHRVAAIVRATGKSPACFYRVVASYGEQPVATREPAPLPDDEAPTVADVLDEGDDAPSKRTRRERLDPKAWAIRYDAESRIRTIGCPEREVKARVASLIARGIPRESIVILRPVKAEITVDVTYK